MASGGSSKSKFTKAFTKRAAKTSVPRVLLSRGETFAKTREGKTGRLRSRPSRHGTSRILELPRAGTRLNACLNLLKPAIRVAPLNTRAGQIRQDALAQGVSPMVARYPNSSPRVLAKLAPKASYGLSARRSPSYGFVVVLEAEASVTQAALKRDD
jgi:hypothetical protein